MSETATDRHPRGDLKSGGGRAAKVKVIKSTRTELLESELADFLEWVSDEGRTAEIHYDSVFTGSNIVYSVLVIAI